MALSSIFKFPFSSIALYKANDEILGFTEMQILRSA
ncbi:hypothetical protein SLEP1_g4108 [Rubroshorea leprosula]|uniref:Uncharacterized protein n=1 Tax=Rubroshorea leprosula TaxID=152421 RepID=A0AAV5HN46_9ROSI|nr:hypothetical protein SLEP1_g4108 [Rubroshorea leprosula]